MMILNEQEFQRVSTFTPGQLARIGTAFHEAGHALSSITFNAYFEKVIVHEDPANGGIVEGHKSNLPDGTDKLHEYTLISLAGWAADEIFNNTPIKFIQTNGHGYNSDINNIHENFKKYLSHEEIQKYIEMLQPAIKKVLTQRVENLKAIAFALFEKGELSYEEVNGLIKTEK